MLPRLVPSKWGQVPPIPYYNIDKTESDIICDIVHPREQEVMEVNN